MRYGLTALLVAVLVVGVVEDASADTISTIPSYTGGRTGSHDFVAQSFTAVGDGFLQTLRVGTGEDAGSPATKWSVRLYGFNKTTGTTNTVSLWTSTDSAITTGVTFTTLTVNTALTVGSDYAFVIQFDDAGEAGLTTMKAGAGFMNTNPYSEGQLYFGSALNSWSTFGTYDAAFEAVLGNPVPEPGSLALLALGTLGLYGVRRRRRTRA